MISRPNKIAALLVACLFASIGGGLLYLEWVNGPGNYLCLEYPQETLKVQENSTYIFISQDPGGYLLKGIAFSIQPSQLEPEAFAVGEDMSMWLVINALDPLTLQFSPEVSNVGSIAAIGDKDMFGVAFWANQVQEGNRGGYFSAEFYVSLSACPIVFPGDMVTVGMNVNGALFHFTFLLSPEIGPGFCLVEAV